MNTNRTWDPSVIGMTPADKAEMTEDEQRERMVEEVNRAADILQHVVAAFGEHLRSTEQRALRNAAAEVIRIARAAADGEP